MRHLRLLGVFWKSMLLYELEYRANFIANTFVALVWGAWSFIGATVFFQYTTRLGDGWTYFEALVVLGLFLVLNGVLNFFMRPNLDRLIQNIRTGALDFILTKPINSQFYASMREIALWAVTDIAIGTGVITWALTNLGVHPDVGAWALFALLLVAAVVILYTLVLMLATSAFWFVDVDNIIELLSMFFDAGRFPRSVYPNWMRIIVTFIVPIALMTSLPAEVVLGRLHDPWLVVYAFAVAAVLFAGSAWFWNYAVRHYSSASS